MITDFFPIPEIGCRYRSKAGDYYIIKDFQTDLGAIPDYVEIVCENSPSGPPIEHEAEEWNALEAEKVSMSEPVSNPKPNPQTSDPQKDPQTTDPQKDPQTSSHSVPLSNPNETPSSEPKPESTKSDGMYSSDPRINELAKLLESGPRMFNQDFFPTDKSLSDNNMVEHDVEEAFQKTLDEIDALRDQGRYEGEPYIEVEENGVKIKKPNPERKEKRASFINEFLWTCGGVDKDLLRMCPTDWAKKAGMGGTILGTAVLATFSGGFAAYTISDNIGIAIIIGIIWGLVIFNLDRYLVNSMYSDGEPTISKQEFLSGLPRIIIAIFLGIVISTPIELKIFDGKINDYLSQEKATYIETCKDRDLAEFNKEDSRLKTDYENAAREVSIVQNCMVAEEKGLIYNRSTGEITKDELGNPLKNPRGAGNGDAYKELKKMEPLLKQKANNLKTKYDLYHAKAEKLISKSKNDAESDYKDQIGLSKKLEAMSAITDTPTSCWYMPWTWSSLAIVRFFISLMFIILEILPVVNKMMQTDGEYDKLIDLESDTREKLTRIKEFNNINVLRSGNLSIYRNQILYGQIPSKVNQGLVDESNEGNKDFAKSDFKKDNKKETDNDNHEIYKHAREVCKKYIITKIDKLFEGTYSGDLDDDFYKSKPFNNDNVASSTDTEKDPSNEAINI